MQGHPGSRRTSSCNPIRAWRPCVRRRRALPLQLPGAEADERSEEKEREGRDDHSCRGGGVRRRAAGDGRPATRASRQGQT